MQMKVDFIYFTSRQLGTAEEEDHLRDVLERLL
jgi:hypothetical protein